MQHIKGCCCYFRQGHFYPLCPLAASFPLPFSRFLSSFCTPWGWNRNRWALTRLSAQRSSLWPTSTDILHAQLLLLLLFFLQHAHFFVRELMRVSSFCSLPVIKRVYATVFYVIVELLLGLARDYYSVSALLLPLISIFSPSFIQPSF